MQKHRKGGSGKKDSNPRSKEEIESKFPRQVRLEYLDPIVVKHTDPRYYKPSLRELTGWEFNEPEDEYYIIVSDKSLSYQPYERLHPEVAYVIPKSAVLGIWDITGQSLRSGKNN